jgi:hypothetical protein
MPQNRCWCVNPKNCQAKLEWTVSVPHTLVSRAADRLVYGRLLGLDSGDVAGGTAKHRVTKSYYSRWLQVPSKKFYSYRLYSYRFDPGSRHRGFVLSSLLTLEQTS